MSNPKPNGADQRELVTDVNHRHCHSTRGCKDLLDLVSSSIVGSVERGLTHGLISHRRITPAELGWASGRSRTGAARVATVAIDWHFRTARCADPPTHIG